MPDLEQKPQTEKERMEEKILKKEGELLRLYRRADRVQSEIRALRRQFNIYYGEIRCGNKY